MTVACGRSQISFGSRVLNTGINYVVDEINDRESSAVELNVYPLLVKEGSIVGGGPRYAAKVITVKGRIIARSPGNRQLLYDRLVRDLNNGIQSLRVGADDDRYYLARLQGSVKPTYDHEVWQETVYEASFLAADAFAYASDPSTKTGNVGTSFVSGDTYTATITVSIDGSGPARPRFTITLPAVGGPYGVTQLSIKNISIDPLQEIIISRAFANSDILVVDSESFEVFVNGILVNYSGMFPLFDPRAGLTNDIVLTIIATIIGPNLDYTFDWINRWL